MLAFDLKLIGEASTRENFLLGTMNVMLHESEWSSLFIARIFLELLEVSRRRFKLCVPESWMFKLMGNTNPFPTGPIPARERSKGQRTRMF